MQDRQSHFIRRKPASNLHHAVRIAKAIGLPLTHTVTLNFSLVAVDQRLAGRAFARLRTQLFGHWARRPSRKHGGKAFTPTFVWVVEAVDGFVHIHWMLHLPCGRITDFRERLPSWVAAVAGEIQGENALTFRVAYNPRGFARYMLKGMDPALAETYGIDPKAQGLVHGKRSGFSQNLGPAAKRALRQAGQYPRARPFRYAPIGVQSSARI